MKRIVLCLFLFACAPKTVPPVEEPMLEQPPEGLPDPTEVPDPGDGKPSPN